MAKRQEADRGGPPNFTIYNTDDNIRGAHEQEQIDDLKRDNEELSRMLHSVRQ